ncbi:hypothetical protein TRVA0_003S04280 [Trichomonascus vanleenenianus]|uniref:Csi2p n=1 Tax=Trichomonascus vanleenenianus TaxID=2268995 RepID=UPI003EC95C50
MVTGNPEKRHLRVKGELQDAPRLHKRQDNNNKDDNNNNNSQTTDNKNTATTSQKAQTTQNTQSTQSDNKNTQTTSKTTSGTTSQTTNTDSSKTTSQTTSSQTTSTKTTSTSSGGMPTLASSTTSSQSMGPLPTLHLSTGAGATETVPTPDVTVPSMADNPYMTSSSYPEGTVFIAVGAILGGLGLAILAWRMFASISLSRSLKKSGSMDPLMGGAGGPDDKLFYPGDPSRAGDVNQSTSDLRKSMYNSSNVPGQSLFFSPTAEVMNSANSGGAFGNQDNSPSLSSSMGNNNMAQRSSVYLPAGYYTPGGGPATGSMTSRHLSMARESLYAPSIRPSSTYLSPNTANTQPTPQQRAPSAYLDDLLAHE